MLMVNQLVGFGVEPPIVASAPTLTYIGEGVLTTNVTSYNYGNFNAASDGLMIVAFMSTGASNLTVNSVSIGGTNGTIHETNAASNERWALASRVVSAGNNNVTVTLSGSGGARIHTVGVWLLTGYTDATPYDTFAVAAATSSTATFTYDSLADAVAVFGIMEGANAVTNSWSSATERYDAQTSSRTASYADKIGLTTATGLTETVTISSSVSRWGVCGVWR
jgi:hypothetical protein